MAAYKWRTKIQAYLAKIAGYDVETPKGTTREQQLMKEISDSYAPLPAIEEADEGKVLGVSDGKWAAIDVPSDGGGSGGGVLVVGLTYNDETGRYAADKTAGEIYEALTAGTTVQFWQTEHQEQEGFPENYMDATAIYAVEGFRYIHMGTAGTEAFQFDVYLISERVALVAESASDYPVSQGTD